jgi:hypothetical protein
MVSFTQQAALLNPFPILAVRRYDVIDASEEGGGLADPISSLDDLFE